MSFFRRAVCLRCLTFRQRSGEAIESQRRTTSIAITHPVLSEGALLQCLDDGLQPSDWMRLLNQRVFFWVDRRNVDVHLRASIGQGEKRVVLVLDTLSVMKAYHRKVQLAAINTGSTIRRPARRGLSTFSPAYRYTYREWQRLRGGRDHIKELTILDGIIDVDVHMIGYYGCPHLDSAWQSAVSLTRDYEG